MNRYQEKKNKALINLKYYLIFCSLFTIFNFMLIISLPSYTFPKNFFAIWPIAGWGFPTLWKFLELRRFKEHA